MSLYCDYFYCSPVSQSVSGYLQVVRSEDDEPSMHSCGSSASLIACDHARFITAEALASVCIVLIQKQD